MTKNEQSWRKNLERRLDEARDAYEKVVTVERKIHWKNVILELEADLKRKEEEFMDAEVDHHIKDIVESLLSTGAKR